MRAFSPLSLVALFAVSIALFVAVPSGAQNGGTAAGGSLAEARRAIDAGDPARALALLGDVREAPERQMLRGIARIMLGELRDGARDLERAVDRDPALREGWMNLAALEIAERDYETARTMLEKAVALDPQAADGHLNLGAVLVLLGRRGEASGHFDRYLELAEPSAESFYLVAANYALAGAEHLAIKHLRSAIGLDERVRLQARRDDRFLTLDSLEYRELLSTDAWQPPAGSRTAAAAFRAPYDKADERLLFATLDALRQAGLPYDGEVEATLRWALVWGEGGLRVKVHNQDDGTGVVRLSAPPEFAAPETWQRTTRAIFSVIHERLRSMPARDASIAPRSGPVGGGGR
ncbi:MAG: tetratricopeptide repeat protein [Acidobacteriota bacterium]